MTHARSSARSGRGARSLPAARGSSSRVGGTGHRSDEGPDARRRLSQNFFRKQKVAARFAEQVPAGGGRLVEIGPGSGRITRALAEQGHAVAAVEIDAEWSARLRELDLVGVEVVTADFLAWTPAPTDTRFVGNLPFGVSTKILRTCLERGPRDFTVGVFLLQEEFTRKRVGDFGGNSFNAEWSPWFTFRPGLRFSRFDFQPVPRADTATLVVEARPAPLVPWGCRALYQQSVGAVYGTSRRTLGEAASVAQCRPPRGVPTDVPLRDLKPADWVAVYEGWGAPSVGPRVHERHK